MQTKVFSNLKKRDMVRALIVRPDFLGVYADYDGVLTFLSRIWPLLDMPSQDPRYNDAYGDAKQHLVNNDDWTLEDTLLTRFGLLESDDNVFIKFLETVVSPEVRGSKDSIHEYVAVVNALLEGLDKRLVHVDYFEELPIFRLVDDSQYPAHPAEIMANNITFYKGQENVKSYPCFVLVYSDWDDYSNKTTMYLQYREANGYYTDFGKLNLMCRDHQKTWDVLPESFAQLGEDYCSLGSGYNYYRDLKNKFSGSYQSVLYALRDVALFPRIADEFEDDGIFKNSLLRMNESEELMRTLRFSLADIDIRLAFKFNFTTKPPYANNELLLDFDFQYGGEVNHRIYGLIGKNGTGKTRILSSLIHELSKENPRSIRPRKPIYGKVFSVSYSFFDRFDIPEPTATFNYIYCGLKKREGGWLSEAQLRARFYQSAEKIKRKNVISEWFDILITFIPSEIVSLMFNANNGMMVFDASKFGRVNDMVSSGQNILLFIITEIIAQIRYNSLIIYDEPETHLHPNAISELMNTIFTMVENFNSFCIIATHSPIVIQELQSRNIYVLERLEDTVEARKLDKEVFAENLTVITEDIFGRRDVAKHYQQILTYWVFQKKLGFVEIVDRLENDELPLSLNARLYIKGLIAQRDEKA